MPAIVNLTAYRGDDWEIPGQVIDEITREPVTDYFDQVDTAYIEVKRNRNENSVVTFNLASSEIELDGALFTLIKDNSLTDIEGGVYQYDMQCTLLDGDTRTLVRGSFTIEDDITIL